MLCKHQCLEKCDTQQLFVLMAQNKSAFTVLHTEIPPISFSVFFPV